MNSKGISGYIIIVLLCLAGAGCGKKVEKARPVEKKVEEASQGLQQAPRVSPPAQVSGPAPGRKVTLYSFEGSAQYWDIPEWAREKQDYTAKSLEVSKDCASDGSSSLKLTADFPGRVWTAALIELEEYLDWTPYKSVSCDIFIPKDTPEGLKAKIILTVGEDWKFTEMTSAIFLVPGSWTTVGASLEPDTSDWRMTTVDDNFRKDVRKIAIRIESNKGPTYAGPIYVDNFRAEER